MNKKVNKKILLMIPFLVIISFVIGMALLNNNLASVSNSVKPEVSKPFIEVNNNVDMNKKTILNNNKYIRRYQMVKKTRPIDEKITEYASYFNLDGKKVVEIARKLTNNYTSDSFKNNNSILEEDGIFNSKEAGIVYFIRYLYRNPEKYGATKDIIISNRIDTEKNKVDGHIVLKNGMTYEQFLAKICDLYGINKVFALAIVYEESGIMSSSLFNYSNNMGGLRGNGGWLSFPSLEAGTISYVFTLKNLLDRYNVDSFNKNSIYYFSGIYVHGNINDPADHWTGNITGYMSRIENNHVFE